MDVFIHYFIRIILPIQICGCILLIAVLIFNRYTYDLFLPRFEATKNEIGKNKALQNLNLKK